MPKAYLSGNYTLHVVSEETYSTAKEQYWLMAGELEEKRSGYMIECLLENIDFQALTTDTSVLVALCNSIYPWKEDLCLSDMVAIWNKMSDRNTDLEVGTHVISQNWVNEQYENMFSEHNYDTDFKHGGYYWVYTGTNIPVNVATDIVFQRRYAIKSIREQALVIFREYYDRLLLTLQKLNITNND